MLIYRDTRRPRSPAPRWPSHLVGAEHLCRRESDDGDLVAIADPLFLNPPAPETIWHPLPDDWEFCLIGALDPESLARRDPGCPLLMVRDSSGHPWRIPAILDPDGQIALPMKLGITGKELVNGSEVDRWEHRPTAEQAALITAARGARIEILAGRLDQLALSVACSWMSMIIPKTYHLSPPMIAPLEVLDNRLIGHGLMACAGYPMASGD